MNDPFSTLGITPNASEDEIKSAYRKLAKKYHPDVNGGSADSEAKMKEINEAYSEALKIKRSGGTYNPGANRAGGYSGQSGYSGQGGYGYSGQQTGYDDPFAGFGFGDFGFGGYQRTGYQSTDPELRAARNYINTGHYQEALNLLQRTNVRSAEWFYLSARANIGVGNRTAALTYARQAAQMDPDNYEYAQLLSRLEGNTNAYRHHSNTYGGIPLTQCSNPCMTICLINMLCNCCCRGFWC